MSFDIQKFGSPGMLEFIKVEVYTSETLGVFLPVLSISQFGTHMGKISKTMSSLHWVTCWLL
jgi:hypothetical protein